MHADSARPSCLQTTSSHCSHGLWSQKEFFYLHIARPHQWAAVGPQIAISLCQAALNVEICRSAEGHGPFSSRMRIARPFSRPAHCSYAPTRGHLRRSDQLLCDVVVSNGSTEAATLTPSLASNVAVRAHNSSDPPQGAPIQPVTKATVTGVFIEFRACEPSCLQYLLADAIQDRNLSFQSWLHLDSTALGRSKARPTYALCPGSVTSTTR